MFIFPPSQLGCLLCIVAISSSVPITTVPAVDLGYAKYSGEVSPAGVSQFLGMRYAAPPLGNLRFRSPKDPLHETELQNATSYGPICLSVQQPFQPVQTAAEDCLFINVQKPALATNKSKLPVMIWFQGGAFITNFNADYKATSLIHASSNNVIVVTFNFRVGLYGFLTGAAVKENGDLNSGFLDQQKALLWVQKHISSFGGDPENVTLFGTSAGAGSTLLHTLAYGNRAKSTKPLFHAIIAADPFVPEFFTVPELEFQYQEILNATKCSSITCLRSLSTSKLQAANINRPFPGQNTNPLFGFSPCVDGSLFPARPSKLLAEGWFQHVPLLQGTVANEGSIFAPHVNGTSEFASFLSAQFPKLNVSGINEHYSYIPLSPSGSVNSPYFDRLELAYGDASFTCFGLDFASKFAAAGIPVYSFLYNVLDPNLVELGLGVPHTWEVGAVWGPGNALNLAIPKSANSYENINSNVVPIVQAYWTSFARTHDPNTLRVYGSPTWKRWGRGLAGQRLKIQTNATIMETISRQQVKNCEFWKTRSQQLVH